MSTAVSNQKRKGNNVSKQYIEPIMFGEIVFENESFLIRKICHWEKCSLWKDEETGLLKVLLPGGQAFNVGCIGTYAFPDGTRATKTEFNYIGDFNEGLAQIAIKEKGYGFIDSNANLVIPAKYNNADDFQNGFAVVSTWDENNKKNKWLFLDKDGGEHFFKKTGTSEANFDYMRVSDNSDGMFRVSYQGFFPLAYFSDYDEYAGIWGYADSSGKEVIEPQYIYAFDFEDGLALVCKGEWTKDKKWDNKYNTGRYWTETEQWGMIDKTGKEIIPCIFDEINFFSFAEGSKYLQAHYGGWKEGKWGVINYSGGWVVEPIFGDLGYEIFNDDYFTFYNEDKWNSPDEIPMGIYSIKERRILFEPQFMDVDFLADGTIKVEVYDDRLKRNIEKIIDHTGKTILDAQYQSIYIIADMYMVTLNDTTGRHLTGLIDKNGKEILPCKYEISYNGMLLDQKRLIIKQNEKLGVMTFDEKIIIPPEYSDIHNENNNCYQVKLGGNYMQDEKGKYGLIGLDGTTILSIQYDSISIDDDLIIARNDFGSTLYRMEKKTK